MKRAGGVFVSLCAAALAQLGPAYRFRTQVLGEGARSGPV